MAVISVHGEVRHHQPRAAAAVVTASSRFLFAADRDEASSHGLVSFKGSDSIEVDEDMHLALPHHMYKAGNYKEALEHSTTGYGRNPNRTDNLKIQNVIRMDYTIHIGEMLPVQGQNHF